MSTKPTKSPGVSPGLKPADAPPPPPPDHPPPAYDKSPPPPKYQEPPDYSMTPPPPKYKDASAGLPPPMDLPPAEEVGNGSFNNNSFNNNSFNNQKGAKGGKKGAKGGKQQLRSTAESFTPSSQPMVMGPVRLPSMYSPERVEVPQLTAPPQKVPITLLFGPSPAVNTAVAGAIAREQKMDLLCVDANKSSWERAFAVDDYFASRSVSLRAAGVVGDVPLRSRADFAYLLESIKRSPGATIGAAALLDDGGRSNAEELAAAKADDVEYIRAKHERAAQVQTELANLFNEMGIFHQVDVASFAASPSDEELLKTTVSTMRAVLFKARLTSPLPVQPISNPYKAALPGSDVVRTGSTYMQVMSEVCSMLSSGGKRVAFPVPSGTVTQSKSTVASSIKNFASPGFAVFPDDPVTKRVAIAIVNRKEYLIHPSMSFIVLINAAESAGKGKKKPASSAAQQSGLLSGTVVDGAVIIDDCLYWGGADVTKKTYYQRIVGPASDRYRPPAPLKKNFFSPSMPAKGAGIDAAKSGKSWRFEIIDGEAHYSNSHARLVIPSSPSFTLAARRSGDNEYTLQGFVVSGSGPQLTDLPCEPITNKVTVTDATSDSLLGNFCLVAGSDKDAPRQWEARLNEPASREAAQGWPTLQKAGVVLPVGDLLLAVDDVVKAMPTDVKPWPEAPAPATPQKKPKGGASPAKSTPSPNSKSTSKKPQRGASKSENGNGKSDDKKAAPAKQKDNNRKGSAEGKKGAEKSDSAAPAAAKQNGRKKTSPKTNDAPAAAAAKKAKPEKKEGASEEKPAAKRAEAKKPKAKEPAAKAEKAPAAAATAAA